MADDAARYLGFAFASADLLFELDSEGVVTFAVGAARQVAGVELDALAGASLRDIVADEDLSTVDAFLGSLESGDRRGPIRIALKPKPGRKLKRYGALCACRLPQLAPRISCSLTLRVMGSVAAEAKGPHGLHNAESFAAVAENALKQAAHSGVELNMELVELAGLRNAAGALGKGEAAEAMQRVAAALRAESIDGASAAELHPERYAVLRSKAEPAQRLTERLERLISDMGLGAVKPTLDSMAFDPVGGARRRPAHPAHGAGSIHRRRGRGSLAQRGGGADRRGGRPLQIDRGRARLLSGLSAGGRPAHPRGGSLRGVRAARPRRQSRPGHPDGRGDGPDSGPRPGGGAGGGAATAQARQHPACAWRPTSRPAP